MSSYKEFLDKKKSLVETVGFEADSLPDCLFDYQAAVVKWALKKGRAAIFAGTGLGKTLMELAWANAVYEKTGLNVIILAPLSVAQQIEREAEKFGLHGKYQKEQGADIPVTITNYEKLHKFDLSKFGAVVLDESSLDQIEAGYDGEPSSFSVDSTYILDALKNIKTGTTIVQFNDAETPMLFTAENDDTRRYLVCPMRGR